MVATLLLAAALSRPAPPTGHQLTTALGYGPQGWILVGSWTGPRRWGAWFRVDHATTSAGPPSTNASGTPILTSASSIGVAWRALPRLTVGIGYGQKEEKTATSGAVGVPDTYRNDEHGVAAIGTWTFPVNDTVGVAASASAGPGGFGAAIGATFFFP
jgi:hypothetical protein